MPINLASETLLSFTQAARILPGRPHLSTLHRWRLRGVRGIKLESVMIGGRRYTTREALARFAAATTAAADGHPQAPPTTAARRRSIQAAEDELNRAGI